MSSQPATISPPPRLRIVRRDEPETRELRCPGGHLHGRVSDRFIQRKCPQCSKEQGREVFHVWDTETWEMVG